MTQNSQGLVRTIGRWSLTALMVNSIIGGSIFGLPSVLAARIGGYSPFAYLGAGLCILIVAACIAEVSSRYDETGGLYLYARDAFGRFAGLLVAWLTWLTRIAAPAAGANLFYTYLVMFFPALGTRTGELLVLALLIGHLALLNYIGVDTGKQVSNLFTAVKVSFLLFFVIAGLLVLLFRPEIRVPLSVPMVSAKSWFESILLLVYAYGGFEGALFVGGESSNPKRDTPVALLRALVVVGVIYTAAQFVTMAALPNVASSVRPLSDAAQRLLGPAGATAIAFAALVSTYGYLSANLLHAPRVTFALAERGDFPSFLAVIHPKFRTPYVSILFYAVLVFSFAALGNFQWNAMLSAVSRLAIYAAMALAVPVFRSRHDGKAQFLLPAPYLFSGLALLFSIVLITQMGRGEFYVVGATCAIALLNWLFVRR
ncbi:MAG TPA: APC family permease [Candidatus Limnocylindrales bacterium]|nr:APC family permease [Candidatus Limnocylindrales bacterium]